MHTKHQQYNVILSKMDAKNEGKPLENDEIDEDDVDEEDDIETTGNSKPGEGTEGGVATGEKKKKKKPKKKKAATAIPGTSSSSAGGIVYNTISTLPEEAFQAYCQEALKKYETKDLPPPEKLVELPSKFEFYKFTGSLRPAYVSKRREVEKDIVVPDYAACGQPISEQKADRSAEIPVYSPETIAKMRHACAVGREVLDIAGRYLRAGVTGDEIDRIVHKACMDWKAYPSPLNYYYFPKSVCVSPNEIICHGIPDFRPIQDGDIVNIDVSVYVDGVHADLNDMFMIGEVDEDSKKLVKTAYMALAEAASMIKPGTFYRDLGNEISRVATKNGCAVVKKYGGHGVGKLFHCAPNIPHYAKNKAIGIMRPGHIFTIEPMLNLGTDWGDVLWPDKWTVSTRDGKRSAQFEHTFLVTETGCEVLTAHPGTSRKEMIWDDALEARLTRPGSKKMRILNEQRPKIKNLYR